MKLLISGGHLTPALAVIEELRVSHPDVQVVFIGRAFLQEKEGMKSREREEIEKRNIPYHEIQAAKFHRTYLWRNAEELGRFLPSLKQVYTILKQDKPDVFLSFGGYLAVPIAVVCKILGIPVVTHEQTKTAGLANQWIAHFASRVAVSYEDSRKFFPREKTVITGNPVRPSFLRAMKTAPDWLTQLDIHTPLIYVTGGSQGSHVLNTTLSAILAELTKHATVIHQCGASVGSNYVKELQVAKDALFPELQKRYYVQEWFAEQDVAWLFQHARLVLSRSGANTVQEIVVSKIPAVFVPLPFAHNNEQLKNAQWLTEQGSALLLLQKDLLPTALLQTLLEALNNHKDMRKQAEKVAKQSPTIHAAEHIVSLCLQAYEASR